MDHASVWGKDGSYEFFALTPSNGAPATVGNGVTIGFVAPNHAAVAAFHAAALACGGTCDGPPGLRPHYGETYYAAFVIDPDGYRLEAVHQ